MSAPPGEGSPRRVAFVVGTTEGGTGRHVRMLAAGLASRGIAVEVLGPPSAETAIGFASVPGVKFSPVEFGDRPQRSDAGAVLRLRQALSPGTGAAPDVVHAHGLRAGALTVVAFARPGARRSPIVVTVHNGPPYGGGAAVLVYRALQQVVARGADLVLCVSSDLEQRMRAAGARQVARAVVPAPVTPPAASPPGTVMTPAAEGRPVVFAAGRLAAQKGFATLLEAAIAWRDLVPRPLLVIAGDGPLSGDLRAKAAAIGVDARFLGHRDDIPGLLAAAAVFVLPSRWEGQPLVLQEALRAGAAIVATRVGGIPDLTGDDAALLVRPHDPARLAVAVAAVLGDAELAARLRAAARARAARLPSEDDAVAAALASYAAAAGR
ncbi:MAG TPA: glycosyltransferase family 4 protein [Trebonia sp.]|nr:glycosyltransferase family 4 protein [Trebonia sp.]